MVFAFDVRQAVDAVALQIWAQRRGVKFGILSFSSYEQSSSGNKVCWRKAMIIASGSGVGMDECW
jgi:hypothetical protein